MSTKINIQSLTDTVIEQAPEYKDLRNTVMKELLHYEILGALAKEQLLTNLVFQGGTCLRLMYDSRRLSEDLDFVGGVDFDYARLTEIRDCLLDTIGGRYGLRVNVAEPAPEKLAGSGIKVGRWKVSVETETDDRSLPWQKVKIEVANVPAYTRNLRPMRLNYPVVPDGYSTVLINCESREEILADKYKAIATRRDLKARDVWDIVYLRQMRVEADMDMVIRKFADYQESGEFFPRFKARIEQVDDFIRSGRFRGEMGRFLLPEHAAKTVDVKEFDNYIVSEMKEVLVEVERALSPTPEHGGNGPSFTL